jgi:CheY-like chemotaxis protein
LTEASAFVAARLDLGRWWHSSLPEIDPAVCVVFIAADAVVSPRDEVRLPSDYSVIDASTVEAAAALSQGHRLDLVILDLGPSALGGLAMLRQLKADPHLGGAPLVLVGAFDDLDDIREGLKLGARDYLIRGETTPSLVARRVRSWLDAPARRALSRRSSRPTPNGHSPAVRATVAAAPTGVAQLFRGAIVGLIVVLLKQTVSLVVGRDTKRA